MRSALFALFLLVGCQTPAPPPAETPAADLAGTQWRRIDDENANPHGATLAFTERGASGDTQCNRWFSAVTYNGEELRFGNVGVTRRACLSEVQAATEHSFLAVLEATRYVRRDGDELILLDAQRNQIARFYNEQ